MYLNIFADKNIYTLYFLDTYHLIFSYNINVALHIWLIFIDRNSHLETELRNVKTTQQQNEGNNSRVTLRITL